MGLVHVAPEPVCHLARKYKLDASRMHHSLIQRHADRLALQIPYRHAGKEVVRDFSHRDGSTRSGRGRHASCCMLECYTSCVLTVTALQMICTPVKRKDSIHLLKQGRLSGAGPGRLQRLWRLHHPVRAALSPTVGLSALPSPRCASPGTPGRRSLLPRLWSHSSHHVRYARGPTFAACATLWGWSTGWIRCRSSTAWCTPGRTRIRTIWCTARRGVRVIWTDRQRACMRSCHRRSGTFMRCASDSRDSVSCLHTFGASATSGWHAA